MSVCRALICALRITAPVASATTPWMVALATACARASAGFHTAATAAIVKAADVSFVILILLTTLEILYHGQPCSTAFRGCVVFVFFISNKDNPASKGCATWLLL